MEASWKATTITVPGSTGSVAYTPAGWAGKTPKLLLFFGTNWGTYDAAITSNGAGLFRGMAAPRYTDAALIQSGACCVSTPAGNAHHLSNSHCINMLNTGGGLTFTYTAICTALSSGGFTLNWDTVTGAGSTVIVVALFDVDNVGATIQMYNSTISLGWRPDATILHGAWGSTDIGGSDRTQEFYGGAAYPLVRPPGVSYTASGVTAFCFPTAPSGQYVNELGGGQPPHIYIVSGGHFTGPFLVTSNIVVYPTGTGETDLVVGGDAEDGGMVVAFDDTDNWAGFVDPATSVGGTSAKTGLLFAPALLLGYTLSNEPDGQGTGSRGGVGLSVVTPDMQWCATIDGGPDGNQGAYQSLQRGFCDAVSGTNVHAGTVELTSDGFVLTTDLNNTTKDTQTWHAFGHAKKPMWIPQMSRYSM